MANIFDQFDPTPDDGVAGKRPTIPANQSMFDQFDKVTNQQNQRDLANTNPQGIIGRPFMDFMDAVVGGASFGGTEQRGPDQYKNPQGEFVDDPSSTPAARDIRSPKLSAAGKLGGRVLSSLNIGRFMPGGASTAFLPQIASGGVQGGGESVLEDVAQGKDIDPLKAVREAGIGATLTGVLGLGARAISPRSAVRAAGTDWRGRPLLSEAEKRAATELATQHSVPLRADEAISAIAERGPTVKAAEKLKAAAAEAATTPSGSVRAGEVEAARIPKLQAAVENVTSKFGPGVATAVPGQQAGKAAIDVVSGLVERSADDILKSGNQAKFLKGPTKDAAYDLAEKAVLKDPILKESLGKMPKNSLAYQEAVVTKMDEMAASAKGRRGEILTQKSQDARNALESKAPQVAESRVTRQAGESQAVEPLVKGPLGQVSRATTPSAQGSVLFGQNTKEATDAAIDAQKRLAIQNPDVVPGLLSSRVQEAAAKQDPTGFASTVFPTAESMRAARAANPAAVDSAQGTIDALRATRPLDVDPRAGGLQNLDITRPGSWIPTAQEVLGQKGARTIDAINDPNIIKELGQLKGPALFNRMLALGLMNPTGNLTQ